MIATTTAWIRPALPIAGDPGPFRGTPGTRLTRGTRRARPRTPPPTSRSSKCSPRSAWRSPTRRGAVLVAPPGAGKTTVVPLWLLDQPWLGRRAES